jgi:digeranylgeranylglycerophospholipid reductase
MPDNSADVLVVGGGPGGLFVAERLARAGVHTIVCEEHAIVGDPVHCTGVLAAESFDELDLPRDALLNTLTAARFVSPSGITIRHETPTPLAAVIDRPAFDRALARRSAAAGADIRTGVRVSTLDVDASGVNAMAGDTHIRARLAILACGASYAFQRRLGLGLPRLYLHSAQRELPVERPCEVELHFGRDVAPQGFAWAVPVERPDGPYVRIGIMAERDALAGYRRMVERMRDRLGIAADAAVPRQKILPLGAIDRTVGDRVMAIGDAAGLVKPTTGGGIYYSILSARLAADVAADALRHDRLDGAALSAYERAWRDQLDDELRAQNALRAVASELTDDAMDRLFELARTDGIMPIVRSTARFNRHRDLIWALFKHPPARKVLFRSVLG